MWEAKSHHDSFSSKYPEKIEKTLEIIQNIFFNKTYVHVDTIPWKGCSRDVVEQLDVDSSEKGWRDQENPHNEE